MNLSEQREYSKKSLTAEVIYRKELKQILYYFREILETDYSAIDKCSVCGMLREWSQDCYSCNKEDWYSRKHFINEIKECTFRIKMHIDNLKAIKKEQYDRCRKS